MDDEPLEPLAETLKALANEKRLHLLRYLTTPHYIREIATELDISRQSAQAHVDQLVGLGVLDRVHGRREHGPVTEYVVVPSRLFGIQESFSRLGRLEPARESDRPHGLTEALETDALASAKAPVSRLVVVHGMRMGDAVPLTGEGPWLVGRDPGAALCLDYDPFVSTRHAEVRRSNAGYELADLYSRNGTTQDWEPLQGGEARALESGAILGFGRTVAVFRRPS